MLIIEDGSGVAGANSWITLAEADAHCVPRGLWAATPVDPATGLPDAAVESAKEAALLRACDALGVLPWKGTAVDPSGLRAWPRRGVPDISGAGMVPDNAIPPTVARAQAELAALMFAGTSNPLAARPSGGRIKSMSWSHKDGNIDVLGGDEDSQSVTYADDAPAEDWLPSVYLLIAWALESLPGQAKTVFGSVLRGSR